MTGLELSEVGSTNTWLLQNEAGKPDLFTVYTFRQTAGRGQTGNHWESEPGKNLSFSTLFRLDTIEQTTRLNMLIPLAVLEVVMRVQGARFKVQENDNRTSPSLCDTSPTLGEEPQKSTPPTLGGELKIKWPNDIYWREKKLAGLLNENVFVGHRPVCSVAGVGLNVNQTVFRSDAPNPVSLKQITGKDYPLVPLLEAIVDKFAELRPLLDRPAELHEAYMSRLFRREGLHAYEAAGTRFSAAIEDVDAFGRLVLKTEDGQRRAFGFKEVKFVL